jgi:hypothetical protein
VGHDEKYCRTMDIDEGKKSNTYMVQEKMMTRKDAPHFNQVPPPYNTTQQQYNTMQPQYNNAQSTI